MHSLRVCIEAALPSAPKQIPLRRYVAQGYIGLFVEEEAAGWLRDITKNFANDVKRHGMQDQKRRLDQDIVVLFASLRHVLLGTGEIDLVEIFLS